MDSEIVERIARNVMDSYTLAMQGCGLEAHVIIEINGTVEDAIVNHFDELVLD